MKQITLIVFSLIGLLSFVGCAATSPAITADKAAIAAATTQATPQEASLQAQLTTAQNALAVATSQPSMAPQLAGLQATVAADEQAVTTAKSALAAQLAALQTKLATDETAAQTQQQATATQLSQLATAAVPVAAPASSPWGPILGVVGPVLIAAILGYVNKANTASSNATAATTSTNHTTAITQAVVGLANSVPVSALPASTQPAVAEAAKLVDAVGAAVTPAPAVSVITTKA